jgi:hypothetical protein
VSRLGLDLLASKVRRPPLQPGAIRRPLLLERLRAGDRGPIVSVVAPPGYGKTTLLAEWAEANGQSFAWVSVDEADNDPKVLLSYVAEALDAVEPIGERVFDALASPGSSVPGSVVPRLGSAFSAMTSPVALVLDDVHLLHNLECRSALSVLADHVPPGSRLALAGRAAPPLRIARLRAEGKLLEIGPGDLSLTLDEASSLLRNARLALGTDEVAELHQRTEGWPVALYLAALCLREGSSFERTAVSFGGDNRLVSDYVESEFFARISRRQRAFLTRTAVLERMCGPLCDAVLGLRESAVTLAGLARSNLLLVPLDRRGEWYRYHHLFRDMLLAELRQREPDLIPVLYRRAAQWCEDHQAPGHRGRLRRERLGKIWPHREGGPQQVRGQHERQRGLAVMARAASSTAGRGAWAASARNSVISRVFPIPACPVIATTRPTAPIACHAARSAASSASRPTSGQTPGAGRARSPAPGRPSRFTPPPAAAALARATAVAPRPPTPAIPRSPDSPAGRSRTGSRPGRAGPPPPGTRRPAARSASRTRARPPGPRSDRGSRRPG